MSHDAIHNPSAAATNAQAETTEQAETRTEKIVEQPKETEDPAETLREPLLVESPAGGAVQDSAGYKSSLQANQPICQAIQARRVPGRPTLKMSKEQLMRRLQKLRTNWAMRRAMPN